MGLVHCPPEQVVAVVPLPDDDSRSLSVSLPALAKSPVDPRVIQSHPTDVCWLALA